MNQPVPGPGLAPHEDGEIAYLIAGEGPVIATAHPSGTPKAGFRPLPGFTTITVWPRGFGRSSSGRTRQDYGLYALPNYLDAVRRHLGLERWVYLGVSQGAMAGLIYALKYPATLSALILDCGAAGSFYRDDPDSIWPEVWRSEQSAAFQKDPNPETLRDFKMLVAAMMGSLDPAASWEESQRTQDQNADAYVEFRRTHFDLRSRLSEITVPTSSSPATKTSSVRRSNPASSPAASPALASSYSPTPRTASSVTIRQVRWRS
jgi:proline iminopeptidase